MYEVFYKNTIIGLTELENADPPMGFVHGAFKINDQYHKNKKAILAGLDEVAIYSPSTHEALPVESVSIEDYSEEFGEVEVQITVLIKTSEEFDKHFLHHRKAYEQQFK